MTLFLTFYLLLIGLILGSFYNVVGLRVPKGELFKQERSYCPNCHQSLRWYELIPIFSYILQKGRCLHCQQKISPLYPLMELFSGLSFSYSYWVFGFQPSLILALLLLSMFHIIIVSDLRYMVIPDKVLLFFTVLFVIYRFVYPTVPWWGSVVGALTGLIGTAVIIVISRGGMGGGDMKLFAVIGLALGTKLLLLTFFLATFIGAIVNLTLIFFKVISRDNPVPFGPYIAAGGAVAIFYGSDLIDWYLNRFF
ncbi:type 4 prepilin-like proteins leader peptide-processing enzyme [Halobacillus andaensis]|uniref:Type 4 prepilin-like proteins leader peptide-processing enzyme n=1 Tax=Halobacillus andaensis TaxID=1176239 RepID=A0A917AZU7_HALAA|nr:A24 family peptidase [Halobacillus andaensis]MBP2002944.1 leader peptidase (prepilin peptidase)/N-methyltransferase [Halobacillus andaensis]GGF06789.1 type 4 prepilin-like proteins leader peptide-processing enzyme [Halobacillus andaensis]